MITARKISKETINYVNPFDVPTGVKLVSVNNSQMMYTLNPPDYARYKLYFLLDQNISFSIKNDTVREMYSLFLTEKVQMK